MNQQEDCIFCQIISGKNHCHKIYEDELTLAFLDLFPAAHGHLLIVPKEHFTDIFEVSPQAVARVAENSVIIADALQRLIKPDGLGVFQLNKAAAGQTVFHYHMHLIPQAAGKPVGIHAKNAANNEQLQELARQLRAILNQ